MSEFQRVLEQINDLPERDGEALTAAVGQFVLAPETTPEEVDVFLCHIIDLCADPFAGRLSPALLASSLATLVAALIQQALSQHRGLAEISVEEIEDKIQLLSKAVDSLRESLSPPSSPSSYSYSFSSNVSIPISKSQDLSSEETDEQTLRLPSVFSPRAESMVPSLSPSTLSPDASPGSPGRRLRAASGSARSNSFLRALNRSLLLTKADADSNHSSLPLLDSFLSADPSGPACQGPQGLLGLEDCSCEHHAHPHAGIAGDDIYDVTVPLSVSISGELMRLPLPLSSAPLPSTLPIDSPSSTSSTSSSGSQIPSAEPIVIPSPNVSRPLQSPGLGDAGVGLLSASPVASPSASFVPAELGAQSPSLCESSSTPSIFQLFSFSGTRLDREAEGGASSRAESKPSAARPMPELGTLDGRSEEENAVGTEVDVFSPGVGYSLEQLVERITHPAVFDSKLRSVFLTTYHWFTTPTELLLQLIGRFQPGLREESGELRNVRTRVVGTIKALIGVCSAVTEVPSFREGLDAFLQTLESDGALATAFQTSILQIQSTMRRSMEQRAGRKRAEALREVQVREARGDAGLVGPRLADPSFAPTEFAEHVTLLESDMYLQITPAEILAYSRDKGTVSPHLSKMIEIFNGLSSWLILQIVGLPLLRDRVVALTNAVLLARELFALHNFSGVSIVMAALGNSAVRRLKRTWSELAPDAQQALADLEERFRPEKSFRAYRELLVSTPPPYIPYLGIFLTDLTFLDDGNKSFLDAARRTINMAKFHKVFDLLSQIQNSQVPYAQLLSRHPSFPADPSPTSMFLLTLSPVSENELYRLSTLTEPRDWEQATKSWLDREAELLARINRLESSSAGNQPAGHQS